MSDRASPTISTRTSVVLIIPDFITMLSSLSPIPLPVTFVMILASLPGPL